MNEYEVFYQSYGGEDHGEPIREEGYWFMDANGEINGPYTTQQAAELGMKEVKAFIPEALHNQY